MNSVSISVVMAVHNEEDCVRNAIDSVLVQTFRDFEFIIVNDGSTDGTEKIINSYKDNRILVIKNKENISLAASLNKAIKIASGNYIARMDADDICLPNRFEEQYRFMEQNRDIDVCGTWCENYGYFSGVSKFSTEDFDIRVKMLHECHIVHPSVLFRSEIIREYLYDESFEKNQDYELWGRIIDKAKFANIPKALIKYRQIKANETRLSSGVQRMNDIKIRKAIIDKIGVHINERELDLYKQFVYQDYSSSFDELLEIGELLEKLVLANSKTMVFIENEFQNYMATLWWNISNNSTRFGLKIFKLYFLFDLLRLERLSLVEKVVFLLKSILKK